MFKCFLRDIISETNLLPQQVSHTPRNTLLQLLQFSFQVPSISAPMMGLFSSSVRLFPDVILCLLPRQIRLKFSPRMCTVSLFILPKQVLKLETNNFPRNTQKMPIKYTVTYRHTLEPPPTKHHRKIRWSNRRLGSVVR